MQSCGKDLHLLFNIYFCSVASIPPESSEKPDLQCCPASVSSCRHLGRVNNRFCLCFYLSCYIDFCSCILPLHSCLRFCELRVCVCVWLTVHPVCVVANVFTAQVTLTQFSQFVAQAAKKQKNMHTKHLPVVSVASGSFMLLYFQHQWTMIALFTARINMRLDKHIFLSRANKMLYHRAFPPHVAGHCCSPAFPSC